MKYRTRDGNTVAANEGQDRLLGMLYGTLPGRMLLKPLVQPWISKFMGCLLDSRFSTGAIVPFIEKNHIRMSDYKAAEYKSYNDFFKREVLPDKRPLHPGQDVFISPCDAKLTVYPIRRGSRFTVKHTDYTLADLLKNKETARHYEKGQLLLFRLTVDDYHHFCYPVDGVKTKNVHIPGVFHTVNPLANDVYPVYKENTREYSLIKTRGFGTVLMMEVGALFVGKIVNRQKEAAVVSRGEEKGYFEFGGSTIIVCLEPGAAAIDDDLLENSADGIETIVKMGEKIGIKR